MSLFVAIQSCVHYLPTRGQAVLETWAKDLPHRRLFTGGDDFKDDGDVVQVICSDRYEELPRKTVAMIHYFLETPHSHLLKCDDDTLVKRPAIETLNALLMETDVDYSGFCPSPEGYDPTYHFRKCDYQLPDTTGFKGPWASGGMAYILSRRAATIVRECAESIVDDHVYEDKFVGDLLRPHGIILDPRPWNIVGNLIKHPVSPAELRREFHRSNAL